MSQLTNTQWTGYVSTTWRAPDVAVATTVPFNVTVVDPGGHEATIAGSLTVNPVNDAASPTFTVYCPGPGDAVLADDWEYLHFLVKDSDNILNYSIFVDGQPIVENVTVNATQKEVTQSWRVPSGALPGDVFIVRYEAHDYAGNVGFVEVDFHVPVGTTLTGTQTLASQYSEPLVLDGYGVFTVPGDTLVVPALTLVDGAILQGQIGQPLHLVVAGSLVVTCGSRIDHSGAGYQGGTAEAPAGIAPPDVAGATPDYGGSHGGLGGGGWPQSGTAGEVYDSVYEPKYGGSGAAYVSWVTGRGGGVIVLDARDTVLNGLVEARAFYSGNSTGDRAAGGTVVVRGQTLRGVGTVSVRGGDSITVDSSGWYGAGAGGRVALHVADMSGFAIASRTFSDGGCSYLWNYNRGCAGAGTVFSRVADEPFGRLAVGEWGRSTQRGLALLPSIGSHVAGLAEPDASDPSAVWIEPSDPNARFDLGVEGMWV
ncbi:MAG: hypothetical protein CO106_06710, partial [Deltaproteobacteria bacterium CG_4_9_14_3_um_filter_44_9]